MFYFAVIMYINNITVCGTETFCYKVKPLSLEEYFHQFISRNHKNTFYPYQQLLFRYICLNLTPSTFQIQYFPKSISFLSRYHMTFKTTHVVHCHNFLRTTCIVNRKARNQTTLKSGNVLPLNGVDQPAISLKESAQIFPPILGGKKSLTLETEKHFLCATTWMSLKGIV